VHQLITERKHKTSSTHTHTRTHHQPPTTKHHHDNHCSFMMKATSFLLSLLPSLALACRCMQPTLKTALYDTPDSIVIAGRITGELKLTTTDDFGDRYFAMRVAKVYRAPCSIQEQDVIIVSTSASSASCGLDLKPFSRYIFSVYAVEQDNALLPAAVQVSVNSCAYNFEGVLSTEDKTVLREYKTSNKPYKQDCNPPTPCKTGAECDPENEYCDATKNVCVALNVDSCPCLPTPCFAAPCSVALPCEEAVNATQPVECLETYCCGCAAIFVDATRTQICNSPS
jgi:hypothetical protein